MDFKPAGIVRGSALLTVGRLNGNGDVYVGGDGYYLPDIRTGHNIRIRGSGTHKSANTFLTAVAWYEALAEHGDQVLPHPMPQVPYESPRLPHSLKAQKVFMTCDDGKAAVLHAMKTEEGNLWFRVGAFGEEQNYQMPWVCVPKKAKCPLHKASGTFFKCMVKERESSLLAFMQGSDSIEAMRNRREWIAHLKEHGMPHPNLEQGR